MNLFRTTLFRIAALGVVLFFILEIHEFFQFWSGFSVSDAMKFLLILAITIALFLLGRLSPHLERIGEIPFWSTLLMVYFVSRLLWLINIPTLPTSDFYYYYKVACEVALGKGLVDPVTLYQNGWGYQLFLGGFFHIFGCDVTVGKVINVVLNLLTLPLFYLLASRFGGRLVGRWAVILFTLWPVNILFSSVLATEHLALPLFSWVLVRRRVAGSVRNPWLSTVICGFRAGIIVRPAIVCTLDHSSYHLPHSYPTESVALSAILLGSCWHLGITGLDF
jgi:hypothetical protein